MTLNSDSGQGRTGRLSPPPTGHAQFERETLGLVVTLMRISQHVVTVVLIAIGTFRAGLDDSSLEHTWLAAYTAGLLLLLWYISGALVVAGPRRARLAPWWVLGFGLVWVAAVAVSSEFVWVAFVLWLLAGHILSTWASLVFSLAVYLVVVIAPLVHEGHASYAEVFGPLIGGVFALGVSRGYVELLKDAREREELVESLRRTQEEMADLQDELALSQRESGRVSERTRVARDLHDTIAQDLSSIRLVAHLGAEKATDEVTESALLKIENAANSSIADLRRIVAALTPVELEDNALASAIVRVLTKLGSETGIDVEYRISAYVPILPTEVDVALLRTLQSALANVRKHAGATYACVGLGEKDGGVYLEIIDDGRGFDVVAFDRTSSEMIDGRQPFRGDGSTSTESGFGLRFMRARLRELGGRLEIDSAPGAGTRLTAYVPYVKGGRR